MTLGQRICMYRTRQQLSQAVLAEQLEVSRQSVSKWETDASVPELDKLIRMSELFDVSLEELIKGQPAKLSSNEPRKEVVSEKISEQIVSPETTEITEHEEAVSETEPTQKHTQSHAASAEKEPLSWQKIVAIFFFSMRRFEHYFKFFTGDLANLSATYNRISHRRASDLFKCPITSTVKSRMGFVGPALYLAAAPYRYPFLVDL